MPIIFNPKLDPTEWADRYWQSFLKTFTGEEPEAAFKYIWGDTIASQYGGEWNLLYKAVDQLVGLVDGAFDIAMPVTLKLSASAIARITGTQIADADFEANSFAQPSRDRTVAIGADFMGVVDQMFNPGVATELAQLRNAGDQEFDNLRAYLGTNLLFQLRSLTIGWVSALVPHLDFRHLEALHQSVNWAFGFGWLSWTVMSEYMSVTTLPFLRRNLNRQVKPNDFSEAEIFSAMLRGSVSESLFNEVLDNQGMRDDIRSILLDIREPNLSETDVRDLVHRGEWEAGDVFDYFRDKGFRQERAQRKAQLLLGDRGWKLEERLTDLMERQFRDCAISETEFRQRLQAMHYTALEEELAVQVALQERRLRRFLSVSQNLKAMDATLKDETAVRQELACQGFSDLDVDVILGLDRGAAARRPRITVFSVSPGRVRSGEQVEVRWVVEGAEPGGVEILPQPGSVDPVGSFILTVDQNTTFELRATNDVGTVTRQDAVIVTAAPQDTRLPTATLSVRPGTIEIGLLGTQVEVEWRVSNADSVTILPDLGAVPLVGSRVVRVNATTTFRLVATNAAGETIRENTVLAEVPDFNVPDIEGAPRVSSFSIRPGTVDAGDPVELRWQVEDAERVFIEPGVGEVGPFGTLFPAVINTTTFTLRAENEEGETVRQRSVIVRPLEAEPEPAPPPVPRLSFNIRPGTADIGQQVVLEWDSTNADEVEIEGIPGVNKPQGGYFTSYTTSRVIAAVARGPGGETVKTASVIIRPPAPPPEPDAPPSPTARLSLRPGTSKPGQEVAIEWEATHVDTVTITPELGSVGPQGSRVIRPLTTTTYTLVASGPGGIVREIRTLLVRQPEVAEEEAVTPAPSVTFSVRPATIDPGDEVEVTWRTEHAQTVEIQPGIGSVPTAGTFITTLNANTIFTLTAVGVGGTTVRQDTVLVRPPAPEPASAEPRPPTARISVRPGTAEPGDQLELQWVVDRADRVFIEPFPGEVEQVGTAVLLATETTTFTLSADGPGGKIERQDTVLVNIPEPEGGTNA